MFKVDLVDRVVSTVKDVCGGKCRTLTKYLITNINTL